MSEQLTDFQKTIRDRFYQAIHGIPSNNANIKESSSCSDERCLVLELIPVSPANCSLNLSIHPWPECNLSIENVGKFDFSEGGDINSWILPLEMIWDFIEAVLCGQVKKVSFIRNGKVVQSTINLTVDGKEFGSTAISFLLPVYKLFGLIEKVEKGYEAYPGVDGCIG